MDRGSAHLSPQATGREPDEPLAVAQRLSRLTGRKVWGQAVRSAESHQVESGIGAWGAARSLEGGC